MPRLVPFVRPCLAWGALLLLASCERAPLAPGAPNVPVSAVTIAPPIDTVSVGGTAQFTATVYDTLGQPIAAGVTWLSSDAKIFTVSAGGRVRGVSEGTAELIAAVGGVRDSALVTVLPINGGWVRQTSSATADLNGVFFQPDGRNGWAVGDGGTILHTSDAGTTWSRQSSGTAFTLNAVWFTSATEGWAVGANGTVLLTSNGGTSWTRFGNVGQSEELMDVQFATSDIGWAVGANGLVVRTIDHGQSWETFRVPTAFTLESVSFAGTLNGWAVGDGGVIAGTHDGGASWYVLSPSITIQSIKAVMRRSEGKAWAAGSQGVTPRTTAGPDSTEWDLLNAGASRQLEGVYFPTDLTGFAVGFDAGLGGTVLRTDDGGTTWNAQVSNASARLNDVFFVDPLRGWAVGQAGTIVHTGGGGLP
jgi:hypothetical protein